MSMKGIAQETLRILENGRYEARNGAMQDIGEAQRAAEAGTVLYRPEQLAALMTAAAPDKHKPTQIEVRVGKTREVARTLVQEQGAQICLLNYASARNAGGGFIGGARAQEEDLARSSGLYPCLLMQPDYYAVNRQQRSMLYTDHIIYSPDVPFFRDGRFNLLPEPFLASVITAPAPNAGEYIRQKQGTAEQLEETLRRRAGYVLAVARDQGCRTVLLGAWGCGVFRNDPALVASAFGDLLSEDGPFHGVFDRVVFGIYDGRKPQKVLHAFEDRFGTAVGNDSA